MKLVTRNFAFPLEVRESDTPVITGYAAVFEPALSLDLGGFREKIRRDAFDETLKSDQDVMALWSHSWSMPIGRMSAGTLKLSTDEHGLAVEITPDDTTWSRDALASVRSGNVKGMSFGFLVLDDTWQYETKIRTLNRVSLHEVSLVTMPAYPDTEAAVRSLLGEVEQSYDSVAPVPQSRMALAERTVAYLNRKHI